MSDTPRTDAEVTVGWSGDAAAVDDEFARQLERELNAANAERELLRTELTSLQATCAGYESSVLHLSALVDELRAEIARRESWQESMGFQDRVVTWAQECFRRPDSMRIEQRAFRFIEEALELVQSAGTSKEEVLRLVDYVFARPIGEVAQEIGGVMVTLAALSFAAGRRMDGCGEVELQRCIANTDEIRAKDLAKPERSPLPGSLPPTEGGL